MPIEQHIHLSQAIKNYYDRNESQVVRESCKAALDDLRAQGVAGDIYAHFFHSMGECFGLNTKQGRKNLEIIEVDFANESQFFPRTFTEGQHRAHMQTVNARRQHAITEEGSAPTPPTRKKTRGPIRRSFDHDAE